MAAATNLEHDLKPASCIPVLLLAWLLGPAAHAATAIVIVEGLGGNDHYREAFARQVEQIEAAARTLTPAPEIRVFRSGSPQRAPLLAHLEDLAARLGEDDLVLLYLVGHGSYDDREYKFNIDGPDVTAEDLAAVFEELPPENLAVINTSSASGAAHDVWQDDSRTVVTATRSGVERHATRFGEYFVAALSDPGADLDKNNRISAMEAFDYAQRQVEDYFDAEGTLATEHARLSGARAERITLASLEAAPGAAGDDPALAPLLETRAQLSERVEALRRNRDELTAEDYDARLLELMLELATVEETIERVRAGERDDG